MKNSIKLCIVDDHILFVESFQAYLTIDGDLEFIEAFSDPALALEKVQGLSVDILLIDLNMSGMDGLTLLKRLVSNGFKGKIVVLTMENNFEKLKACRDHGASGYITKDTPGTLLLSGLKALHRNEIPFLELHSIKKRLNLLTKQESFIASLVCQGMRSEKIASKLFISVHTVNTHRRRILEKTECNNFIEVCLKLNSW